MKRSIFIAVLVAGSLAGGFSAWAQQAAPTPQAGFSVDTLIQQLSFYMPQQDNPFGGGAASGGAQAGQQGAQGGTQSGNRAPATGAQSAQGAQGAQAAPNAFRIQRDPKLYLTKDQIDKLLPIMSDLKANPLPTPSKAKKIQADVDAILTKAQKAGWDKAQKDLAKAREAFQAQRSSQAQGQTGQQGQPFQQRADQATGSGQAGGGNLRNFQNMTAEERQQFLANLPADQRQQVEDRLKQATAQAKLSPTEQRQRQIEQFIKELEQRRKDLG